MTPSRIPLPTRLSVLYGLTEAIEDAAGVDEMCEAAVDAVLAAANADRASVLLRDDEGIPRFRAWRRLTPEYRRAVEGRSPWSRRDPSPQPVRVADVTADPVLADLRDAFEAEGIRALALLPVLRERRLLGTFVLYRDRVGSWSDDDLDFASHVARQAAFAIDRATTAAKLRDASGRLEVLADRMPMAVLLEGDGRVQLANPEFSRIFDLPPARELVGRRGADVVASLRPAFADADAFLAGLRELRRGRKPRRAMRIPLADGRTLEQTYTPIDASGEAELWTYMDITEQLRSERALGEARRMESLGALAGGIAHDFNELLQSILIYTTLLGREVAPGGRASELVDSLARLTSDATDTTRRLMTLGESPKEPGVVLCLDTELEAAVVRCRRAGNVEVTFTAKGTGRIVGEPAELQRLFGNLLANAREASPAGGRIDVTLDRESREADATPIARISIRDSGPGIPPEIEARLSEPFFSTKPAGAGQGLGITTAARIAMRLGGSIRISSHPDGGAEAIVLLPLTEREPEPAALEIPAKTSAPVTGATLLLVDDQAMLRAVLGIALRRAGFEILEAASAEEALARLAEEPAIAVVVTDALMPDTDGWELSRRVRQTYPLLPIVMMSGCPPESEVPPDVEYLQKPFAPDKLAEAVRTAMQRMQR
jgi:signal transduction histidine kinase